MGRAGKNCAGAVIHHHKIGDPNRQWRAAKWVLHGDAGIKAFLFSLFHRRFCGVHFLTFGAKLCQGGVFRRQALGQRVVCSQANERGTDQSVGAGGVNGHALMTILRCGQREGHFQPARLANPIFLHQADFGGPIVQPV